MGGLRENLESVMRDHAEILQTHAEIARTLRVSVGSVRLYIARALRQCLELAP